MVLVSTPQQGGPEEVRQILQNLADMAVVEKLLLTLGDFSAHMGSS